MFESTVSPTLLYEFEAWMLNAKKNGRFDGKKVFEEHILCKDR